MPSQEDIEKLSNLITQVSENKQLCRGTRQTNSTGCIRNEHSKTSSPSINKSKKQQTIK